MVFYPRFCLLFQRLVLYGMYPHVLEKLDKLLATGARFGVQVRTDNSFRRLDCHILDGLSVKVLVLAVFPEEHDWGRVMLKNVEPVLTCVSSCSGLSFVSVCAFVRLGRALAAVSHPVMPLVSRRLDMDWQKDLLTRQFLKGFSGLEPFGVLEYFQFRLSAVISDSAFDRMPRLCCFREPVGHKVKTKKIFLEETILLFCHAVLSVCPWR